MKSVLLFTLMTICFTAQAEIYACADGVITDLPCKGRTVEKRPSQITRSKHIYACGNNIFADIPCAGGKILKFQPGPSKETQQIALARLQKELRIEEQKNRRIRAEQERAYKLSLLERAVTALESNVYQTQLNQTNLLQRPRRIRYPDQQVYNIYY